MTRRRGMVTRRTVLATAGGGLGALALPELAMAAGSEAEVPVVDVIVVGTGAAGLSAAIAAKRAGASVLMLEKGPATGGTTAKSDGAYWIPNNHLMRAAGLSDPKAAAIAYMAKTAYPTVYRKDAPAHGLSANAYGLIESFYDEGASIIQDLIGEGVLRATMVPLPDYVDHTPENQAPKGRLLLPTNDAGQPGGGVELVRQMQSWLELHGVVIRTRVSVDGLIREPDGSVTGVIATARNGAERLRARKGVIFASGGYTHNREMVQAFQPGPIFGGCAVPTNRGDFVRIGSNAGAKLGNMVNAWRAQLVVETAIATPSVARDIWQPPGDSMILVNRHGRRVVDEKRNYHERTRVHFVWDPLESEYVNRLLFMIYDQRTAELFAGNYPLPSIGQTEAYVVAAPDLPSLRTALATRLAALAPSIGNVDLSDDFHVALSDQIRRYSDDAQKGIDSEFGRGLHPYDDAWHSAVNSVPLKGTKWPPADGPHPTLHAFSSKGPYYAIIIGAGMLDTNGGPVIDPMAHVIDYADRPIPGLYGAGNCIASPAAAAYWGAGGTIGPAIVFGTIAGRNAASEATKKA